MKTPLLIILLATSAFAAETRVREHVGRTVVGPGEAYDWTVARRPGAAPTVCIFRHEGAALAFGCPGRCGKYPPDGMTGGFPRASAAAAAVSVPTGDRLYAALAEAFASFAGPPQPCELELCLAPNGTSWPCGCPAFACD